MKKVYTLIVCVIMGMFLMGCVPETQKTADDVMHEKQKKTMREAVSQTGLPAMKNFQEKKMMKMLYELRDREDLVCYAYLVNQMNGEVGAFIGKCIGYGLPASTQYSNPSKIVDADKLSYGKFSVGCDAFVLPQAEPNGLFMPEGLSATWLMMIDPETNEPRPVYIEPLIIVSPFPMK